MEIDSDFLLIIWKYFSLRSSLFSLNVFHGKDRNVSKMKKKISIDSLILESRFKTEEKCEFRGKKVQ